MGMLDLLSKFAPGYATRYAHNRLRYEVTAKQAKNAARLYDAATTTQFRKPLAGGYSSPDAIIGHAGTKLRDMARHLEENHDLTNAIFDDILNNVVGAGCAKVPMMRLRSGELATDINKRALELFDEWSQSPDTAAEFGFEEMERMVLRHYIRDGEIFMRPVINSGRFNYRTPIPYVIDLLPADFCPLDYQVLQAGTLHGVEVNSWGAPTAYYFYKDHPNDLLQPASVISTQVKRVRASSVYHLKMTKRIRQRRGVPLIHAVIQRMQDLKDYEESERIAAKVAASFTFAITKSGEAGAPTVVNSDGNREFGMSSGMGFELMPGEDVTTIDSNRPNSGLNDFRNSMLRATAGGTGTRYSAISKDYNGTYSAQRQELVEGAISYRALFATYARKFYRPIWSDFVLTAAQSGLLGSAKEIASIEPSTLTRCEFRPPSLPWIDPQKEAKAYETLIGTKVMSHAEAMRKQGFDPTKMAEEMREEMDDDLFTASAIETANVMPQDETNENDETSDDTEENAA